jgi:hypothetical protein
VSASNDGSTPKWEFRQVSIRLFMFFKHWLRW